MVEGLLPETGVALIAGQWGMLGNCVCSAQHLSEKSTWSL
jgi:hypothetical protein